MLARVVAVLSVCLVVSPNAEAQNRRPTVQSQASFQVKHQARTAVPSDLQKEVTLNTDPDNPEPPYGMVLIPGGEVVIGTDPDEVARLGQNFQAEMTIIAAETPRHTAVVEPFFLDETEVTNLQWKVYLDATGRTPSEILVEYGWPGGKIPEGQEDFPITNVNLPEINDFLAWCGKRLPTEEEWTRAARGDDARDYPWGDRWNSKVVKYGGQPPAMPVAVDSFEDGASPYGVLNMAGNVFEWVDTPYSPFEDFEPIDYRLSKRERLQLTPEFDSRRRVAKGGCFVSTRDQSRIDYRLSLDPLDSDAALGFRAARSIRDGVEVIRHGYRRLLPSLITDEDSLDFDDVFAQERATYLEGSAGRIISGFRYLAFAHPKPERQAGLARMRKSARDEPVTLGLLTTSEPLMEPNLPPGDYVVAYKAQGESKKHKEERRNRDRDEEEEPVVIAGAPNPNGDAGAPKGGVAPWPGIAVNDVLRDIDFPQDKDVFLFYNVNNAVVGWAPTGDIRDDEFEAIDFSSDADGRKWDIEFSLDVVSRRVPRFTLSVELAGPGLGKAE